MRRSVEKPSSTEAAKADARNYGLGGKTAVVGMPLSGKTTLARALRQRIAVCPSCIRGIEIVELDEEVECRERMCIADLFAERGEAYFRKREAELLAEYVRADQPVVVFAGGGAVACANSRIALLQYDRVVFLRAQLSTLKGRMNAAERAKRPILQERPERIGELYEQRNPLFHELATDIIDVDSLGVFALADLFMERFMPRCGDDNLI